MILSWDAVTASDLAGYKIYSKDGTTYTLIQNIEDINATSFEISGGDIESSYVITSYDSDLDGTNDQLDGNESWYSSEFSKLSFSLSVDSDDKLTTVGDPSTYDKWILPIGKVILESIIKVLIILIIGIMKIILMQELFSFKDVIKTTVHIGA